MKNNRILAAIGVVTLLASAAFAQSPNQIPVGAGTNVDRAPPGTRAGNPANATPAAAQPTAANPDKRAVSQSCSQQADAKGLHGKARKAFRGKCKLSGSR